MTTDTERKLDFIATRVQLARQRHARLLSIRNLDIEDYVLLDGGCVTRLKSRHIVFSVGGVKQASFTGKWGNIVDKMLLFLDTRLAENREDAAWIFKNGMNRRNKQLRLRVGVHTAAR